ncbi:MAG: hypothetical protein ABIW76_01470 [Fibrobacteria bacterium]
MGNSRKNTLTLECLQEILPDLEVCARRAVEGVLSLPTYAPRGFRWTPSKTGMSIPSCCTIHCWNTEYSLSLSVGIQGPDLEVLMPEVAGKETVLDALGEVVNVLAGRLLAAQRLVDGFGHMAMSPPLFSEGGSAANGGVYMQGMLVAKSTRVYFGFALTANGKEEV